jgi:hypothetical protein
LLKRNFGADRRVARRFLRDLTFAVDWRIVVVVFQTASAVALLTEYDVIGRIRRSHQAGA